MVKKASTFVATAASALFEELHLKYGLVSEARPVVELELYKILLDYVSQFSTIRENTDVTEYEMLLLKHKNKQAFLAAYAERVGCDGSQAERIYTKLRQKYH